MKKSRQGFLSLQIMLLMVVLAVCASAVYLTFSYFTAINSGTGNITMATVQLNMLTYNSSTSEYELSSNLSVTETELTDTLLPGSTVNITGTRISNAGNKPVYALMNLNVSVKGTGVEPIYYEKWYDCSGHDLDIENFATSTYGASLIQASGHVDFSTTFTFPESDITNDYQGATAKFRLTAYGIQTTLPNTECYVSVPHYAGYMIATNLANIQDDNPGKNLLGLEHRQVITSSSGEWAYPNSTLRTGLGDNHILIGFTCNSYFNSSNIEEYSISGNSITLISNQSGYGLGLDFKCLAGETYTISRGDSNSISIGIFDSAGTYLSDVHMGSLTSYTFTTPANSAFFVVVLRPITLNESVTYTNLQLEKGSSATTFEPYIQYDLVPNEYRAVKYLESTGTQYINTGVTGEIEINGRFQFTTTSATSYWSVLKATGVSTGRSYGIEVNYPTNTQLRVIKAAYTLHTLDFDTNIHTYNETFNVNTEYDTGIGEWVLYQTYSKGRLYNFKIYQSGSIVRNFIPCVRKSDDKPGLFDVVNNVFYTNAGSGEFVTSEKTVTEPLMRIVSEKNLLETDNAYNLMTPGSSTDPAVKDIFTLSTSSYFSLRAYVQKGKTYALKGNNAEYCMYINREKQPGQTATDKYVAIYSTSSAYNFTAVETGYYYIGFERDTSTSNMADIQIGTNNLSDLQLQLEEGNSATTYEPYLRVQDTYNSATGTLTRNVLKIAFDGTENDISTVGAWDIWSQSITDASAGVEFYGYNILGEYESPTFDQDYSYSSHYKMGDNPINTTTKVGDYFVTDDSAPPYIAIRVPYTTLEEWKAYLASEYADGNPVTFWLKLATPVVTIY